MTQSVDAKPFYGYLFDHGTTPPNPSRTLNALLISLGQHIVESIGDKDDHELTPAKLAAFYKEVGGDYHALFQEMPHKSISYIYQATGCQHILVPKPGESDYIEPSVPALTLKGFVRWESTEILLDPKEHVPFIQYAARNFALKHPDSGEQFPEDLPVECFPTEMDETTDRWHRSRADLLRQAANQSSVGPEPIDSRPVMDKSRVAVHPGPSKSLLNRTIPDLPRPELRPTTLFTAAIPAQAMPGRDNSRATSRDRGERRARSRSRSAVRNRLHDDVYARPLRHRSHSFSDLRSVIAPGSPVSNSPTRTAVSSHCEPAESPTTMEREPLSPTNSWAKMRLPPRPGSAGQSADTTPEPAPTRASQSTSLVATTPTRLINVSRSLAAGAANFLGLQTTAWFVLVCATAGSAILTSFSVQQPPTSPCLPARSDGGYYMSLSQSLLALCSLYYLVVPLVRSGDVPVRVLFYVSWIVAAGTSVAVPLVYVGRWEYTLWFTFGSGVAQVAATAFLFENIDGSVKIMGGGGPRETPGSPIAAAGQTTGEMRGSSVENGEHSVRSSRGRSSTPRPTVLRERGRSW